MKGRPAKPRELKIAQGNPGGKQLPAAVVVSDRVMVTPDPPGDLPETAAAIWKELAMVAADAGVLQRSDLALFEGFVVAVARARQARKQLAELPLLQEGELGGLYVNPLLKVERDSWALAQRLGTEFGFTPSSRARLGLTLNIGRTLAFDLQQRLGHAADVPKTITVKEPAAAKPAKKKPAARRRKPAAASGEKP